MTSQDGAIAALFRLTHQFRIDAAGLPIASNSMADAGALYRAGRVDAAEQLCREMIAGDPRHAEALHLLGVICCDRNATDEALKWLSRAVAVAPENPRVHYHLGNALMAAEGFSEAEGEFRQAVALDPALADAFNNLGSTLGSQQRDREAIDAYGQALALRPRMPRALYNMGLAQARIGDLESAIASH
ncbi:MAG: tetratricopeptide repeat protein, partial [Acetobacteraceae bacterium]